MNTHRWIDDARILISTAQPTAPEIWDLLAVAGQATMNLVLALPLAEAAGAAALAMDIRQLQSEIEWTHPDLPVHRPSIAVGMVTEDEQASVRELISDLVSAATTRSLQMDATINPRPSSNDSHDVARGTTP